LINHIFQKTVSHHLVLVNNKTIVRFLYALFFQGQLMEKRGGQRVITGGGLIKNGVFATSADTPFWGQVDTGMKNYAYFGRSLSGMSRASATPFP
jgi:hypothetical protein